MKKAIVAFFLFYVWFFCCNSTAQAQSPVMFAKVKKLAQVDIKAYGNTIQINNPTSKPLNLNHAILSFFSSDKINEVRLKSAKKINLSLLKKDYVNVSHNQGNFYQLNFDGTANLLLPNKSLIMEFFGNANINPHNMKLFVVDRVPVNVRITAANAGWVETISVCNISGNAIPLSDIEINFNYSPPMPNSIWGQPWVDWHLGSQQGTQVILLGGTPWTQPLAPDPTCSNPLTIQFSAAPELPQPTPPFVFKSAGGVPSNTGNIQINMPASPIAGLSNPNVNVQGPNTNLNQIVNWGTSLTLTNLVPGSYKVNAAAVDNGINFYAAAQLTVNVTAAATVQANVQYAAVPTSQVTISLVNSPDLQEPITLSGIKYTFNKSVSNNSVIILPSDNYTVSSIVSGFSVVATPNPLIVPTNTRLTLTYQATNSARFVGFLESWNEKSTTDDATKTNLGNLPAYLTVVNLAFMKPDSVYLKGSLDYAGTGLQFGYPSKTVLKFAVANLHRLHPTTKVLVSVGGPTYTNWNNLNAKAIADFISDYGLDGVDINYMPTTTGCARGTDGLIHCQIDTAFQSYVEALRSQLPRPYLISVTSYGVGAFGQGQWQNTQPQSQYTGIMLPLLRSTSATKLDMINVMSYDLGTTFDPGQSLAAYSNYFAGPISMGVEVPPESWGNHVYDTCQVVQLAEKVKLNATQRNSVPGLMLWSLQKKPTGVISPSNPSAQIIATVICKNLGLPDCNQPILLPS